MLNKRIIAEGTSQKSVDEAIEHLARTVENEGRHIHLHIHKHTHDEVRKLKSTYEHLLIRA